MSSQREKTALDERVLQRLARLPDAASREKLLERHRELLHTEVVAQLAEAVRERVRVNSHEALGLAEMALAIAAKLADSESQARAVRAKANALYALGQNQAAVELHQQARELFASLGNAGEVARTLSASLQPLILLGEYDRAFAACDEAAQIFAQQNQPLGLARLEINRGNILHRQDRFDEALACYQRAYGELLPHRDTEGIAATLSNMAVCLVSLNDFPRALACYEQARAFCAEHGMPRLVAQADYNIAYLHYLRGEYSRAIGMLREARESCQKSGDAYHAALCLLDLSDIYLELRLTAEAEEAAQQAFRSFSELRMGYEAAKALATQAIALSRQGKVLSALELFEQARSIFVREKNRVWPSLVDLYQALVFCGESRLYEARRLCLRALEFFRSARRHAKAALAHLLLAQLDLSSNHPAEAGRECAAALELLADAPASGLYYAAHFLMGQAQEAAKDREGAYACYQQARRALEAPRSRARSEELKLPLLGNKGEVYEALVELCLGDPAKAEEAFGYIEQARARRLRDLSESMPATPAGDPAQSALVRRIRQLREELNWYYHRIELEELRPEEHSLERIAQLQERARVREEEFQGAVGELPGAKGDGPRAAPILLALREALQPDSALVEYFEVRGQILAALMTPEGLEMIPLTQVSRVRKILELLETEFAKLAGGSASAGTFQPSAERAAQAHLGGLHRELLAPLLERLSGRFSGRLPRHLIFVPHGVLHAVPFHALHDGRGYLVDACSVSYAPSAALYLRCHAQPCNISGASLIFGVPDPQAAFVLDEVQAVAAAVPQPELYLGEGANLETLREKGPRSRLVHLAVRGELRQDNPMFSVIHWGHWEHPAHPGRSPARLYDLCQLRLPVELLTLSGCAPDLHSRAEGDDWLGLVRGLFETGAQSLLLALWSAEGKSAAEFMKLFYAHWRDTANKASAARAAMLELRERYPHPRQWAPFVLLGKASS